MQRALRGTQVVPASTMRLNQSRAMRRLGGRNPEVRASQTGVLQKLARVFKEKASQDLDRIMKGTSKTREKLGVVEELFTYWVLEDADTELEELEDALIMSDFGPKTSLKIVGEIREEVRAGKLKTGEEIRKALKASILHVLNQRGGNTELVFGDAKPAVVLIVGVNGGGKTTTIGKLANKFAQEGASVVLAAGDTFRAAAAEQLEEWARRSNAEIVRAQQENVRPDTVLYQAVERTITAGADILLCDTSDGTTGLNMLNQAKEFNESVGLTGIILTKLDGTARGGAVVSVVDELGVPVKFVGVGEGIEDLQPFDPESFVDALFPASATTPGTPRV
ncbi:hypothetical protein Ndes2526A_g02620 [Nannochloris sp. 'desiccata']